MQTNKIYALKDMLCEELEKYGSKGDINVSEIELIDKIAHTVKCLCTILEFDEEEEMRYSETANGGSYGGSYNNSYAYDRGSYDNAEYSGRGSYARGRGRNAKRDSMGRYSRDGGSSYRYSRNGGGYSRAEEDMEGMVDDMKNMMRDLPPEKQTEVQRFIDRLEKM